MNASVVLAKGGDIPGSAEQHCRDTLIEIWCGALEVNVAISDDSDFFDLGGESLSMMMAIFQVNQRLGIQLGDDAISRFPAFRDFLDHVIESRDSALEQESSRDL